MIQDELAKHLLTRKEVRALVGSAGVFRGRVPQGYSGRLAIVLSKTADTPYSILDGEGASRNEIIQVDCVAVNQRDGYSAEKLFEAVRDSLSGYRGQWGRKYVHSCQRLNGTDFAVPPQDGSDNWAYQYTADYSVIYEDREPSVQ